MARTVLALFIAAAFGVTATLGAEALNPLPAAQAGSPSTIKVTGCVDKDPAGTLMLTSAVVEPASSGGAAAGPVPDTLRTVTAFQLAGTGIEPHLSHKVELVGTAMAPPPPPPAPAPDAPGAAAAAAARRPGASLNAANAPRLDVTSMKHMHTYPCF